MIAYLFCIGETAPIFTAAAPATASKSWHYELNRTGAGLTSGTLGQNMSWICDI
jgi:hypothetical protein